jgi:DNA-binding LacI/PurR family transcriptional regulator
LVDRLIAAGHRQFAIIAGPEDSFVGEERLIGARSRIAKAGLPEPSVQHGLFSYESGMAAFRALMSDSPGFDALVAVNDVMAIGAMDCAREEYGLSIPRDLSVVGFDGVDPARWLSYRLTTVRQPVRRMTEAAVAALVERIENPSLSAERRFFAGQFIPGGSARLA